MVHNLFFWHGLAGTRWQPVLVVMLAIGLVFSTATQLRLDGYPIGIGEFFLLMWLLGSFLILKFTLSPILVALLLLSTTGSVLLGAGYFFSHYPVESMRPPVFHDVLAYSFCVLLALSFTQLPERLLLTLVYGLVCAFLLSVLLAFGLGVVANEWSGLSAWFWDVRWTNLSVNPNQFALLLAVLPFLVLHLLLRYQYGNVFLLVLVLVFLLSLTLGVYAGSDALQLAWLGGGILVALVFVQRRDSSIIFRSPEVLVNPVAIAAFLVALMFLASAWQLLSGLFIDAFINYSKVNLGQLHLPQHSEIPRHPSEADATQVGARMALWLNGVEALRYSPLIGLGPGAHSGFVHPFSGLEAHNTFLDWGTQTGLAGMIALLVYVVWLWWQVASKGVHELTAMLSALYFFSMFHYLLRQPLFWILPLLALGLAASCRRNDLR